MSLQVALISMVVGVSLGALASLALVRYRYPGRGVINMLSPCAPA